jgi:hypothetical protein
LLLSIISDSMEISLLPIALSIWVSDPAAAHGQSGPYRPAPVSTICIGPAPDDGCSTPEPLFEEPGTRQHCRLRSDSHFYGPTLKARDIGTSFGAGMQECLSQVSHYSVFNYVRSSI